MQSDLKCRGRKKRPMSDFHSDEKLYLSFRDNQWDARGRRLINAAIRLPDQSCNWSKYSGPSDVLHREGGAAADGIFQLPVESIWLDNVATVVHDPLCECEIENYSHCEIRTWPDSKADRSQEPPKGAPKPPSGIRKAWRTKVLQTAVVLKELDGSE